MLRVMIGGVLMFGVVACGTSKSDKTLPLFGGGDATGGTNPPGFTELTPKYLGSQAYNPSASATPAPDLCQGQGPGAFYYQTADTEYENTLVFCLGTFSTPSTATFNTRFNPANYALSSLTNVLVDIFTDKYADIAEMTVITILATKDAVKTDCHSTDLSRKNLSVFGGTEVNRNSPDGMQALVSGDGICLDTAHLNSAQDLTKATVYSDYDSPHRAATLTFTNVDLGKSP